MDYQVSISARSNVAFDISLHETCVRVGGHTLLITKFSRMDSLQIFLPMVLRLRKLELR